jgi:hypothetical protein
VNTPGQALLYFGCRKAEEDYLYQQDWQDFLEAGALSKLRVAFSRAQANKVRGTTDPRCHGMLRFSVARPAGFVGILRVGSGPIGEAFAM